MWKRYRLMDKAGEGEGGGAGDGKQDIKPEDFAALQEGLKAAQSSISALEAKNRELLQEKADAKKAAEKAAEEAAKKSGDVDALEKSWQEKLANETAERDKRLNESQAMIQRLTSGAAAQRMAAELAVPGSADVLLPHIERRLTVEIKDGHPITRVLGDDGKPSALSLDDLRKEIESSPAFAPLLVGSKASGGGSAGKGDGGDGGKVISRAAFDALGPVERMKHFKEGGKVIDK